MADFQTSALNLAQTQSRLKALTDAKSAHDAAGASIGTLQAQAAQDYAAAQSAMGTLALPLTVGVLSVIDTRAQAERAAGKAAAISFIKANPACTEADAITAWTSGAQPTIPAGLTHPLNDPAGLLEAYIANAHAAGATPDTTWASFAAFVVATPAATLETM